MLLMGVIMHFMLETAYYPPFMKDEHEIMNTGRVVMPYYYIKSREFNTIRTCILSYIEMKWALKTLSNDIVPLEQLCALLMSFFIWIGIGSCYISLGRRFTHTIALPSALLGRRDMYEKILHPYEIMHFLLNAMALIFFDVNPTTTLAILAVLFIRTQAVIQIEEEMMFSRFGEEYYRGMGRFIPGVKLEVGNFLL